MRKVILTWKMCLLVTGLCIGAIMIEVGIAGTIDSATVRSVSTCRAGEIREAGNLANGMFNNLKREQLVVTLTCDGMPYATGQSAVIAANIKGMQEFTCKAYLNSIANCSVEKPPNAPK